MFIKVIGYYIFFKMVLFLVGTILFLPCIAFIGKIEYIIGVRTVIEGYIDELFERGCITEDEKKQLLDVIN